MLKIVQQGLKRLLCVCVCTVTFLFAHLSFCCHLHVNLQEYIFVQRTLNFAFRLVCRFFAFAFCIFSLLLVALCCLKEVWSYTWITENIIWCLLRLGSALVLPKLFELTHEYYNLTHHLFLALVQQIRLIHEIMYLIQLDRWFSLTIKITR